VCRCCALRALTSQKKCFAERYNRLDIVVFCDTVAITATPATVHLMPQRPPLPLSDSDQRARVFQALLKDIERVAADARVARATLKFGAKA
jgi:hypothetical protein